jgi:hypothetical protein
MSDQDIIKELSESNKSILEKISQYDNKEQIQKKYNIAFTVLCVAIIICMIVSIAFAISCNKCVKNNTIQGMTYNALHNFG